MKIARKKETHLITSDTNLKILSERVSTVAGIRRSASGLDQEEIQAWNHLSRRDRIRLLKREMHSRNRTKRHLRWTERETVSIQSFQQQAKERVFEEIEENRLQSIKKNKRYSKARTAEKKPVLYSQENKQSQKKISDQRPNNPNPTQSVVGEAVKMSKKQIDRSADMLTNRQEVEKRNREYNANSSRKEEQAIWEKIKPTMTGVVIDYNTPGTLTYALHTLSLLFLGVIQFFLPMLLLVALIAVLFGAVAADSDQDGWIVGVTTQWDSVMYLTCKYESGGDPGAIGSGGFGGYGFDEKTWGTVSRFIVWAYDKDPDLYAPFKDYMTGENLWYNEEFKTLWKSFAQMYKRQFDADQELYAYNQYFLPAAHYYTEKTGYDFFSAPDAVKAALASISIRNGAYSLDSNFAGVTSKSDPKDIIDQIYAVEQKRHTDDPKRWVSEYQDALAMLNNEIDIYEASTGANGRGYIDWSWKRPSDNAQAGSDIVAYADQFVGNPYVWGGDSLTNGIDCSHFVWRVLMNTGHYNGSYMTSAGWRSAGTPVASLDQAVAGDIICYDGHVAIYDGNGMIVEAKGRKWGITHDRRADHATILAIRRFI